MPNDLTKIDAWVNEHGDDAATLLVAGMGLAGNLRQAKPGVRPQAIFTGIPTADRALAEAAGVAQIANDRGVQIDDVIEIAGILLKLGLTFI